LQNDSETLCGVRAGASVERRVNPGIKGDIKKATYFLEKVILYFISKGR
jgi:hypothetical protein